METDNDLESWSEPYNFVRFPSLTFLASKKHITEGGGKHIFLKIKADSSFQVTDNHVYFFKVKFLLYD